MAKRRVRYSVIDAFTNEAFKGNPAAICFLDEEDEAVVDDDWMQKLAMEFNLSETAFLSRQAGRFRLRWFTPVAEVDLCGHATLAAAQFLFSSGLATRDVIGFVTRSGILTAKKAPGLNHLNHNSINGEMKSFSIELDFPLIPVEQCSLDEVPKIPQTLNGACIVNIQKAVSFDLIVELESGKDVAELSPKFDELQKCAGRGVIITGPAPPDSGFDFFSRFFCPKLGINEDPVCGSAHCALAPYWSKKLRKNSLIAYMASPRGGRLDLEVDEPAGRVRIRGEAVTVAEGYVFV